MKPIQAIQIWYNGQLYTATLLLLYIINDNLTDTAVFYYQLQNSNNLGLAQGNITMDGQTYQDWDTASDINQYAWDWAANELNLTLI